MKLKKLIEKLQKVPVSESDPEVVIAIKGSKAWWVSGKKLKVHTELTKGDKSVVWIEGEIK